VRDLEAIVAKFPDDPEPKAFLAVQIWRNAEFGIEIGSHGAVDALLDQLFARAPLHPAHHFRVHLWDHEKAERALASAAALGRTAPGIAHQWHMGGHIFDDLHRYADAVWQQEASSRVDHAFMRRDRVMPYEIHNYGHNQEWLCRSLMHTGRAHAALDVAKNMVELPRHPSRNKLAKDDDIAGYGRQRLLEVLETFEMWDELVRCGEAGFLEGQADAPQEDIARLRALGIAHCRTGRRAAAEALLAELPRLEERLQKERARRIDKAETEAVARGDDDNKIREAVEKSAREGSQPLQRLRNVKSELDGELALLAGDGKRALELFGKAPQVPPASLARAHQQLGEHDQALAKLKDAVKPGRTAALARHVLALHEAGKADEARAKFAELRKLAGQADLDVPLLARLAPLATECGAPADWREAQPVGNDVGERPDLGSLGPLRWSPTAAPALDLPVAGGSRFALTARRGKPVLLVFHLGFGCVHCAEQLRAFAPKAGDFAAAGIEIVAIGTEPVAKLEELVAGQKPGEQLPFALAADPGLAGFKAYRAYDDFEEMPLHSTVLVDGDGRIRWQDVSFEPFKEVDWLLAECRRLLVLPVGGVGAK
jgi:peroxiredoxin/tetratricopeptide (TPR) repeat protein